MVKTKEERIVIQPVLESVLRYCLKDARERMEKGEVVIPFSALAVKETLFCEEHPGEDPSESFDGARKTVQNAKGADAYGFCYDGYIDLEGGKRGDCLIAEGGVPGEPYGHAIGLPYHFEGDKPVFMEEPIYVSKSLNYMLHAVDEEDETEGEAGETADESKAE